MLLLILTTTLRSFNWCLPILYYTQVTNDLQHCFLCVLVLTVAPKLGEVARISAEEIQVSWMAIEDEEDLGITSYVVKYRPEVSIQKRNTEDLAVRIETDQTNIVLSGLDPRVSYRISVAAKNRAGTGVFSEEVIMKCTSLFSVSLFIIRNVAIRDN